MEFNELEIPDGQFLIDWSDEFDQADCSSLDLTDQQVEEISSYEGISLLDPDGEFRPRLLGELYRNFSGEDKHPPVRIYSEAGWVPSRPLVLEEQFDEELLIDVRNILVHTARYGDADASPQEVLRELMNSCDELMGKLSDVPDTVEQLDDNLWGWFQEP
ncbi:MAG: hypothetical protein ABEJ65_09810, partial [bacterium]